MYGQDIEELEDVGGALIEGDTQKLTKSFDKLITLIKKARENKGLVDGIAEIIQ